MWSRKEHYACRSVMLIARVVLPVEEPYGYNTGSTTGQLSWGPGGSVLSAVSRWRSLWDRHVSTAQDSRLAGPQEMWVQMLNVRCIPGEASIFRIKLMCKESGRGRKALGQDVFCVCRPACDRKGTGNDGHRRDPCDILRGWYPVPWGLETGISRKLCRACYRPHIQNMLTCLLEHECWDLGSTRTYHILFPWGFFH